MTFFVPLTGWTAAVLCRVPVMLAATRPDVMAGASAEAIIAAARNHNVASGYAFSVRVCHSNLDHAAEATTVMTKASTIRISP